MTEIEHQQYLFHASYGLEEWSEIIKLTNVTVCAENVPKLSIEKSRIKNTTLITLFIQNFNDKSETFPRKLQSLKFSDEMTKPSLSLQLNKL